MSKQLVIIRGAPGSGKSTLAKMLMQNEGCWRHFEADMFFMVNGEYKWVREETGNAHAWCLNSTMNAMKDGHNVIVANVFPKRAELKPYMDLAAIHGYTVQVIVCQGSFQNSHLVPVDIVNGYLQAFEY